MADSIDKIRKTYGEYMNEDAVPRGLSELISQYSESRNLKAYIQALLKPFEELQEVHYQIRYTLTLESATGDALSTIGELIGKPRTPIERVNKYFGWQGIAGAESFGTVGDPSIGAPFKTDADNYRSIQVVPVNDDEYRPMLYGQLALNTTSLTVNDIRTIALASIQSASDCTIDNVNNGAGSYKVTFPNRLTHIEKSYISRGSMPKPAGVQVTYADIDGDIAYIL